MKIPKLFEPVGGLRDKGPWHAAGMQSSRLTDQIVEIHSLARPTRERLAETIDHWRGKASFLIGCNGDWFSTREYQMAGFRVIAHGPGQHLPANDYYLNFYGYAYPEPAQRILNFPRRLELYSVGACCLTAEVGGIPGDNVLRPPNQPWGAMHPRYTITVTDQALKEPWIKMMESGPQHLYLRQNHGANIQ